MVWNEVYKRLLRHAERQPCTPAKPPVPLILGGWNFSNDVEKMQRWQQMQRWAHENGCLELVDGIADSDFYWVEQPTTYEVGPMGGPMFRPWDYDAKERPGDEALTKYLEALKARWAEVAGAELAAATAPVEFSGEKARCLIVSADQGVTPPWGSWAELSRIEEKRHTFTRFRAAINRAIAPHEVDHVVFDVDHTRKNVGAGKPSSP